MASATRDDTSKESTSPAGASSTPNHRTRMKAVVQRRYGSPDHLTLDEIPIPTVGDDEVLIRVQAASVHADVWHIVRGQPYVLRAMGAGLRKPKNPVPGTDVAGTVEAVGKDVLQFQVGDEVFGETTTGHRWHNGGAYAEYATAPIDGLALKPSTTTFEQAAAVPTSGLIALQGVRYQGQVEPGQSVLVNGAGGGVGALAVQLAKAYGAEVTGVDSTEKLAMIESIGADHVIDYTEEDFTSGSKCYDLIVDIPGNHSFEQCRRALSSDGTYVLIGHDHYGRVGRRFVGSIPKFAKLMARSLFVNQLPEIDFSTPPRSESMATLREFCESGELTPVVDRTFALSEVPEAIRYLEAGDPKGKVVISVASIE